MMLPHLLLVSNLDNSEAIFSSQLLVSVLSRIGIEVRRYRKTSGDLGEAVKKLMRKWTSLLDDYEAELVSSNDNDENGLVHELSTTYQQDLKNDEESSVDWLKVGSIFSSEKEAIEKLDEWSFQCKTSIVKAVTSKEEHKNGKTKAAFRVFKCPHGLNRKSKSKGVRVKQAVNYTGCKFSLRIVGKDDGKWEVTAFNPDHSGHESSQGNYFMHQNNRKLTPEDRQFVKDMMLGNSSNSNMASALSQRTGVSYSYLDVFNLVKRISSEEIVEPIETHLSGIRSSGGKVLYRKKEGSNDVYILLFVCLFVSVVSWCRPHY